VHAKICVWVCGCMREGKRENERVCVSAKSCKTLLCDPFSLVSRHFPGMMDISRSLLGGGGGGGGVFIVLCVLLVFLVLCVLLLFFVVYILCSTCSQVSGKVVLRRLPYITRAVAGVCALASFHAVDGMLPRSLLLFLSSLSSPRTHTHTHTHILSLSLVFSFVVFGLL
jgi:hypothetical protein